jgi:small subunit ribosomal protein S26
MIAKSREERLRKLYSEDEKRIKEEVAGHKEKLLSESQNADDWLAQELSEIENQIRVQDLERAIETALDNPVDHEFAIDLVTFC